MTQPKGSSAGRGRAGAAMSLAQLRALAHPLRLRLLEMFLGEPRTTKQVAALLGEPPTRLYHHVHALERAGLIRLQETRRKRGTSEKYYQAAAPMLRGETLRGEAPRKPAERRQLVALATSALEVTRRELTAWLSAWAANATAPEDGPPVFARVLLGSDEAQALGRELLALINRYPQVDAAMEGEAATVAPGGGAGRSAAPRRRSGAKGSAPGSAPAPAERLAQGGWSLTIALVPRGGSIAAGGA